MKTFALLSVLSLFICSCNTGPKEISFGEDHCYYCSMTIVDRQFAAQIVTNKGRVYSYDAIECMLNDSENNASENVGHWLVFDYTSPGEWMDATTATYLISDEVQSPMGGNLCANKDIKTAQNLIKAEQAELLNWQEIRARYKLD